MAAGMDRMRLGTGFEMFYLLKGSFCIMTCECDGATKPERSKFQEIGERLYQARAIWNLCDRRMNRIENHASLRQLFRASFGRWLQLRSVQGGTCIRRSLDHTWSNPSHCNPRSHTL